MDHTEIYNNDAIRATVEVFSLETIKKYPMIEGFLDDLKQEMWLFLFQKLALYDSSKSAIETFASKILDIGRRRFLRSFFADKNQVLRLANIPAFSKRLSLSQKGNEIILENIEAEQSHFEATLQRLDINSLKENLHPELWRICEKLQEGKSLRQIAGEMHISRRQLYKKYIMPIRDVCCLLEFR